MASGDDANNTIDERKLAFEREKWLLEAGLRERELQLKEADNRQTRWRSPLLIAIMTAAAAAAGNAVVSLLNASGSAEVSRTNAAAQVKLEEVKAEQAMIIESIKTGGDVGKASANLRFLVEAGLVTDTARARKIIDFVNRNALKPENLPSLPSSGVPPVSVTKAAQALKVGTPCQSLAAAGEYCVQDGILIGTEGKPFRTVDAARYGRTLKSHSLIVMHTTNAGEGDVSRYFSSAQASGSAHVIIDRSGRVTQMVPLYTASFHAGAGTWRGITGINSNSIGIALANWGKLQGGPGQWRTYSGAVIPDARVVAVRSGTATVEGWERFPEAQLAATGRVIKALRRSYPDISEIVGHADVSPRRKIDPGPAFPMARMAAIKP